MLKTSPRRALALALLGSLASAGLASAEDRSAEKILAEIKAVEMPSPPKDSNDPGAVQIYRVKAQRAIEQKTALVGELYKVAPDNDELVKLMPQRWQALMMLPGKADVAKAEIAEVVAKGKNPKLVTEADFIAVVKAFRDGGRSPDPAKVAPAVEEFIKKHPKDDRGAQMLATLAQLTDDEAKKADLLKRMEKDFPESPAVRSIVGERRRKDAVGKPFEIEFVDAIKGGQVSSKTLMGKVVVVDFWATWCGPCVAAMPHMKELYAKYKDQGVEFVGVSLDAPKEDGGYDKLKEYVEKNKIEWPQFYQGAGWESVFSGSWGVNAIPCVFLVDADGKLASIDARDQLDDLIPEYLKKAKKAAKP